MTDTKRRVREFHREGPDGGRVQIAEIHDGGCIVGYLPNADGASWLHWGTGAGGFDATVGRFAADYTFNPDLPKPRSLVEHENRRK